jgi:hypothetical protein
VCVTVFLALLTMSLPAQQRGTAARGQADPAPTFRPVATIKDLMLGIIDPAADGIWGAVWTEVSERGEIQHQPKTDEDWTTVEHHALALAEAANLLKMPGRAIARPEELHGKSTTDPAELTPAQIGERIAGSRRAFAEFADGLQNAAADALKFTRARDTKGLFEAGRRVYSACVACHQVYWYPGSGPPR